MRDSLEFTGVGPILDVSVCEVGFCGCSGDHSPLTQHSAPRVTTVYTLSQSRLDLT